MAPTHEDIERRAFQLWQDRGCPLGSPEVDWKHADQEFSENQASDGDAGGMGGGVLCTSQTKAHPKREETMNEEREEPISRAGRTQDHFVSDTVRDVMSPRPRIVSASATVVEAAEVMRREDIGALMVGDGDGGVGILTDRDIVVRVVAVGQDPSQTPVGDICSRELTTVAPDDSVGQAVRLMRAKAIRRLPVTEGAEIVGMLTIGDIAVARDSRTALADISAAPPNA